MNSSLTANRNNKQTIINQLKYRVVVLGLGEIRKVYYIGFLGLL